MLEPAPLVPAVDSTKRSRYSLIMPTHNSASWLEQVLVPLTSLGEHWEIIVVDDASSDATVTLLKSFPLRLLQRPQQGGQALARNEGARLAKGEFLVFVDSDVVVEADTLHAMVSFLENNPHLEGVFGSYSSWGYAGEPALSRFRNLLHHFVHQHSHGPARSFWTGLGVIRAARFLESGGFDPRLTGIEDVELGYRVAQKGGQFWLEPGFQGRHLKRWSLLSMIKTDLRMRAIPWTYYGWMGLTPRSGLNLSPARAFPPLLLLLAVAACPLWPALTRLLLSLYFLSNLPFYRYVSRHAGPPVALSSVSYLVVHHLCCLLGWAIGSFQYLVFRLRGGA